MTDKTAMVENAGHDSSERKSKALKLRRDNVRQENGRREID